MDIISKPWGQEELVEINDRYMVKRLTMLEGHRCSLQYHRQKKETVYLLSGILNVYIGESSESLTLVEMHPGDSLTIMPGQVHRMEGQTTCVYLEASTPELDDVVRLQDDYKRTTET